MPVSHMLNNLAIMFLQGSDGSFWMPPKGSTTSAEVDNIFFFIFYLSVFFFAIIVVLTVLFAIRYRRRPGREDPEEAPHHSLVLELTWSLIPLALVVAIFWTGFNAYLNMSTPPPNAYEIRVTGMKWKWLFTYPNGWVDAELHAPRGLPVKLVMTSEDVIHSLFIPDFRLKKDVVPGRYTTAWFEAPEVGEHYLFCAEYCGTDHSAMISRVVIHEHDDYIAWLDNASSYYSELPPAEAGSEMLKKYGCNQCHSLDGTAGTGPPLNDLFGREELLKGGTSVMVDQNYIRESILDPGKVIVQGYQGVMPTFAGKVKDEEIDWIIAYLKEISTHYVDPLAGLGGDTGTLAEPAEAPDEDATGDPPDGQEPQADDPGEAPTPQVNESMAEAETA